MNLDKPDAVLCQSLSRSVSRSGGKTFDYKFISRLSSPNAFVGDPYLRLSANKPPDETFQALAGSRFAIDSRSGGGV